jgi:hypothetical protein
VRRFDGWTELMTLTLTDCENTIRQTLDQELAIQLDVPLLVNEAGRWLYSQPWAWTSRQSTLGVTAGNNFAVPPAVKVESVRYTTQIAYWMVPTDIDDIVARRVNVLTIGTPQFWAMGWRDDSNGVPYRTLEFDTTFPTTSTTALTLLYTASWPSSVPSYIPVPPEWEGLYVHVLRAVARGYMEEDMASIGLRLDAIKSQGIFQDLVRMEREVQPRRGMLRGGGVNGELMPIQKPNYTRTHL